MAVSTSGFSVVDARHLSQHRCTPAARAAPAPPRRRPMPAPASERMSRVDTAWLRMDNDVNLMMIVGVLLMGSPLTYDEVCARVADKLLRYDRFRQKVVQ